MLQTLRKFVPINKFNFHAQQSLKFSLKFGERNGLQFEEILRIFPPTDACPTFKPTDVLPNTFRYILKKVRKKYLPQNTICHIFLKNFQNFSKICSIFKFSKWIFIPIRELFEFFSKNDKNYFSRLTISEIFVQNRRKKWSTPPGRDNQI